VNPDEPAQSSVPRARTFPPSSGSYLRAPVATMLDPSARPARKYVEGLLRTSDVFLSSDSVPQTFPALLAALEVTLPIRSLFLVQAGRTEIGEFTTRSVGTADKSDLDRIEAHSRAALAYLIDLAETLDFAASPGTEIALPLVKADGAIVAVLLALSDVVASEADLAFLDAVALQLSQALVRDDEIVGARLAVELAASLARATALDLARERLAHDVTRAALERASLVAAEGRDHILGVVAHELRQPLTAMSINVASLLGRRLAEDDRRRTGRRQLDLIYRSLERLARLTSDLLDVSSIERRVLRLDRGSVVVTDLIGETAGLLRTVAAAKGISIRCPTSQALPMVWCDSGRILQVLQNLVGNAIKFTPEGGTITIRARAQGPVVAVSVSDDGVGIREADRSAVFERFWQASRTSPVGTGIGLSIAKAVIDAHGGQIRVEIAEGPGTTITFTLPVAG
jgi:signal transduction histidine kinase